MEVRDNWKGYQSKDFQLQREGSLTLCIWVLDNYIKDWTVCSSLSTNAYILARQSIQQKIAEENWQRISTGAVKKNEIKLARTHTKNTRPQRNMATQKHLEYGPGERNWTMGFMYSWRKTGGDNKRQSWIETSNLCCTCSNKHKSSDSDYVYIYFHYNSWY